MSVLTINQNVTAVGIGNTTFFGASGGTPPYTFAITTSGAGGTMNPYTGQYTAPYQVISTSATSIDVVTVTDSLGATSSTTITIGGVLEMVCDILKQYLGLDSNHIYVWDQKINQPIDSGLYCAVSIMSCQPFGSSSDYIVVPLGPSTHLFSYRNYTYPAAPSTAPFNTYGSFSNSTYFYSYQQYVSGGLAQLQSVNMKAVLDIDIISRSSAARDQKELIPMALTSVYSEQQQEANSFFIAKLPWGGSFVNLSNIDGAAIPYRYKISYAIQYFIKNISNVPYYTQFGTPALTVNA